MIYREYIEQTDYEQVKALCDKHGLPFPHNTTLRVAVNESGKIEGLLGTQIRVFIEPLISENPIAAVRLYEQAVQVIKKIGANSIRCICNSEKKGLYEKVGFNQIENNKILMQKEI